MCLLIFQILDRITAMPRSQRTEEAIELLNNSLFNCTEVKDIVHMPLY